MIASIGFAQHANDHQSDTLSLNGYWSFKIDPDQRGTKKGWFRETLNTCGWDSMAVPGNWDIENVYANYTGKAWYRRTFDVPSDWKGKICRLFLESVSHDAWVWLNGKRVGQIHHGFLPSAFPVSSFLHYGGDNQLTITVDNTFKLGALWNWGGIRRSVRIIATDSTYMDYQHITAIPDLQKGTAAVQVATVLKSVSSLSGKLDIRYLLSYKGEPVAQSWQRNVSPPKKGEEVYYATFALKADAVKLWNFDHPRLYESVVALYKDGKCIQTMSDAFGIRKVEVTDTSLTLNGQIIRPVGFNLVPDDRTTGNTLPLWRIKKDVDLMKTLGANMARISHLPLPEAFLGYLDQKGMLTFSEVSLWGKNRWVHPDSTYSKTWLRKLIKTQYNHPSVIGWSVGNEIGLKRTNPAVMDYVKGATAQARQLDPTRLAVYVSHSAMRQTVDPVRFEPLILLNSYGNLAKDAAMAHQLHPGKPIFYSEFGKSIVAEDPDKGVIDAAHMLNQMRGKNYLIGGALWTFNDYRSNYTGTGPSQNRAWGVVNVFRQPKRAYTAFKKEFAPVKNLKITMERKHDRALMRITVVPRPLLGIPAYTLKGYRLVWMWLDQNKTIHGSGMQQLPVIHPGDAPLHLSVPLSTMEEDSIMLKVCLLRPAPGLYNAWDTTVYFSAPASPKIKACYGSSDAVRIAYNKVPFARGYKVIYGNGSFSDTTAESIDSFIDIADLQWDTSYQFKVIAVNEFGDSPPSEEVSGKKTEAALPPVIWTVVPVEGGFFIGYSVEPTDFLFEVQYGTTPGRYSGHMVVKNKGVLKIGALQNGQTYYFRLRSKKQWGFASAWSPVYAVMPDDQTASDKPVIHGLITGKNRTLVYFDPVAKAIGYRILLRHKNGRMDSVVVNGSDIHFAEIPNGRRGDAVSIIAIGNPKDPQVPVENIR